MILAEHLYASSDILAERLAWNTAKTLIDAIAERGEARLLVSGVRRRRSSSRPCRSSL